MRYLIIGSSIAGISAAASIRSSDPSAEIIMLSPERVKPYYRPMLSRVIEEDADIALRQDPVEKYLIQMVHGKAASLNACAKKVCLDSGEHLSFDKLLIATGRSPVLPEAIHGIEGPGVFPFRTMEDAQNIQAAAKTGTHAVVLGGGFVGIKAAIALKRRGLVVTIIEKIDRILSEKLDKRGSSIMTDLLKREEIDVVTNQADYEILRHAGAVRSIRLASGRIIDANLIIAATGTEPNTDAFRESGIRINKGIVIQETLQTNVPDVYAAGDVAECRDLVSNAFALSSQWSNAKEMGRLAGMNMAGSAVTYQGFLSGMNTIDILSVPVTTLGKINPESTGYEVFAETTGSTYRKIVFKNDVMVGALFIGGKEDPGVYAHLIKNRIPIGRLKEKAVRGQLGNPGAGNTGPFPSA